VCSGVSDCSWLNCNRGMFRSVFRHIPISRASVARAQLITSAKSRQQLPAITAQIINNFNRTISSSSTSLQSAAPSTAATQKDAEPSSISGYVSRYGGWYPLAGLGGLIIISKEILVLNEELLLATNFATFAFITWLVAGEQIQQLAVESQTARTKFLNDTTDVLIEAYKVGVKTYENLLAEIPLLKSTILQYSDLLKQGNGAAALKARQAARDAVISKLAGIYQRQQADAAKESVRAIDTAVNAVRTQLENLSDEEQSKIMDHMIDILEGKSVTATDPIKAALESYLANPEKYQPKEEPTTTATTTTTTTTTTT